MADTSEKELKGQDASTLDPSDAHRVPPADPTVALKIMSTAPDDEAAETERKRRLTSGSNMEVKMTETIVTPVETEPKPKPVLSKDNYGEKSIQAGVLKMQIESSSVFFGRTRQWKENYVFIDNEKGIYFCQDREAFENKDSRKIKVLKFIDISGVVLQRTDAEAEASRFVVYVKQRAQAMFGPTIELETPGNQDAQDWVNELRSKILVKACVYTVGLNGEFPENKRGVRPNVAVCFSGGGGRAHVCTAGQLRALHHLNLLNKQHIDYLSAVSAGAWATAIFTFYEKGALNDDELFGELLSTDLKKWTLDALQNEPLAPIVQPAIENCMTVASELVWHVNSHQLWERVLGKIFLKPFGLNKDWPFALREDVESIKKENPQLKDARFMVNRSEDRPFFICHGVIIGPEWAKLGEMVPIQFTPLYTGSPYLHKMHYQDQNEKVNREEVVWVGGGMVDSFAFGGDEPESALTNSHPMSNAGNSFYSRWFGSSSSSSTGLLRSSTRLDQSQATKVKKKKETAKGKEPQMASLVFADMVGDFTQKTKNTSPFARLPKPPATAPEFFEEVSDAISSLNLAPSMLKRVFRHAQDALQEHNLKDLKGHGEGVLIKDVKLPLPEVPFSLRHCLGISSDAPGVNLHEKTMFRRLNVQERYWTPVYSEAENANDSGDINTTRAVTMDMGDGGSLDNLGICGMLQRKVRKIIVFCNTNNTIPLPPNNTDQRPNAGRLSLEKAKVFDQSQPPSFEEWVDDDILPLFGQAVDEKMLNYLGTHHSQNKVFHLDKLRPLLKSFQEKVQAGEPPVARTKLQVLENPFWGIEGGWEVDILWIYLDDSKLFRSSLPDDTMQELDTGRGEFARFPNFKTFGNNKSLSFDISLTEKQINLLGCFTEWCVMRNADLVKEFVTEKLPELKRQKKKVESTVAQLEKESFA